MKLALLGVRGSTAAPGIEFAGVGGHTSCVAVLPDQRGDPFLVLDAGTGFRGLASLLGDQPLSAHVVLTHLHWDHVQGLPFLPNADRADAVIDLWIPGAGSDAEALDRLARGFSPPHFPVRPDELRGRWVFHALVAGTRTLGGADVTVAEVSHKGGTTMGVRVERSGRSFAYLPDHCLRHATASQRSAALDLARDVDVLLHGSQFLEDERAIADAFGHGTGPDAVELAAGAGARRLVLIHHAPSRTDLDVPLVLAEAARQAGALRFELPIEVGTEGHTIDV